MDLCQKNETNLAKKTESQNTEEAELSSPCPDERSERNHVCCLLNISDITLEKDKNANDFVIRTGWEEAVQGWGSTSPMACIWPRKKVKKPRVGESSSNCLLCTNISQGSPEARPGKSEAQAATEAGLGKERTNPSQSPGFPHDPHTASRETSKTYSPHYRHCEKKSLQIKEFIWYTDDWPAQETVRGRDPRSHEHHSGKLKKGFSIGESLTSKALLILPPLKAAPTNALNALGKKTKDGFLQQNEKGSSVDKNECLTCKCGSKTVDGKCERRPVELTRHSKVKDSVSVPPQAGCPPLLAQPEHCYLRWSLLPERRVLCPPTPSNVRYLATLQLIQEQGVQNYKDKFKSKEPCIPENTPKGILTEDKQENRSQRLETKMFSRPLLPSLTVSRLVIPVSTHRLL
ncbi:PREDICTED: uncharacterized protein C16orf46 homolog [Chrysochloris asiatica]|uniref:Uncharacterized protein C16orf46 homolog n=1 Tax=Chrysochloris asiatica TaxID=185453 RepID=A0A9B0T7D1_CHRAS|nr:PREDICTED: uncharacterized protein C16orf46 homolog [Chrysochloris asiatica]